MSGAVTRRIKALDPADRLLLIGLLAAAAGTRMPGLGPEALWIDDAWVAYAHRASWSNITEIGLSAPGLSVMLKLWFGLVGFGELRAQLIPFLAGITAPPLAYAVVRSRAGRLSAMIAGGWLLFTPIHIEYSVRVKQYSIEVLLALVIVHLTWRLLEEPVRTERWRQLAVISSAAVLVSFPLASIAGAGCAVAGLAAIARDRRLSRHSGWLTLPAATTVAWLAIVIRHRQYDGLQWFWRAQFIQTDAGLRVTAESAAVRTKDMFEFVSPISPVLMMTLCAGALAWLHWRKPLHALVVSLPLLAAVGLAAAQTAPLGGGRTDLYLLAGLVLGSSIALDDITTRWPHIGVRVAAAVASVGLLWAGLGYQHPEYPIEDVPTVLAALEAARQETDTIFVYHEAKWAVATYSDFDVTVRPISNPYDVVFDDPSIFRQRFPFSPERIAEDVASVDTDERVWLIGSHLSSSWHDTIEAFLYAGWGVVAQTDARGAALLLLEHG